MKSVMSNKVSKETSDKYSEMCSDIAEVFKKYEKDFETKRECEYWLTQALYSVSMKSRLFEREEWSINLVLENTDENLREL